MLDLVAIGELLIDFTSLGVQENGIEVFAKNPGGAPANVVVANSRLGGKTAFIGKVGEDEFGYYLERVLKDTGVSTEGLVIKENVKTTLAFVHLAEDGERSFSFYRNNSADVSLIFEEVNMKIIEEANIVHFGSVSLTDNPSRTATLETIKKAKELGKIISFDPNYREALWKNEEEAKCEIMNAMSYADILKISEEELYMLTETQDLSSGMKQLEEKGVKLILVTLGKRGAAYKLGDNTAIIPGYSVNAVDTNGAGDSFMGAIHYSLRGKNLEMIQRMSSEEVNQIIDFANSVAALVTTRKGAIPAMPTLEEVKNFINL